MSSFQCGRTGAWFAAALITGLISACSDRFDAAVQLPSGNALMERLWDDAEWQATLIRGGPQDSLLASPGRLVVTREALYFFDLFDKKVYALDHDGEILWVSGMDGAGPGEYRHPRDLKIGAKGNLWVLDPETARVTVLSTEGVVLRMLSLADMDYRPDDIVPLDSSTAVFSTFDPEYALRFLDFGSASSRKLSMGLPSTEDLHPLASQLVMSNAESGKWAAAFAFGPYFMLGKKDGRVSTHEFIEQVDFPQVIRTRNRSGLTTNTLTRLIRPVFAAAALTIANDTLHVLFGGKSDNRHRIVDRYSATTGQYLNSILLPRPIETFAYHDGKYYAFYTDVYPNLVRFSRTVRPW